MNHLKMYENFVKNSSLKEGDYIIAHYNFGVRIEEFDEKFIDFLHNNIGQVVEIDDEIDDSDKTIRVKYNLTSKNKNDSVIFYFPENSDIISLDFKHLEILHKSEKEEDLKYILNANKYNL